MCDTIRHAILEAMKNSTHIVKKEKMAYTAVYVKSGSWYAGYVAEVPGVNTQGKTLAEAKSNLVEALVMVLSAQRDLLLKHIGRKQFVVDMVSVVV